MAIRFYFPSTGSPAVTPTMNNGGEWEHVNGTNRLPFHKAPARNSALANTAYNPDAADHVPDEDALLAQLVGDDELEAQTINAQTVSWQWQCLESNAGNNVALALKIFIVSKDGGTIKETLLAIRRDATEMATALTNRSDSATIASATVEKGDRICIEIGCGGDPVATGGIQGHNSTIRFGEDASSGDLPVNDTETGTTFRPWLEFAEDLLFVGPPPPRSFGLPVAMAVAMMWQPAPNAPPQLPQLAAITAEPPITDPPPLRVVQPPSILQSWRGRAGLMGRGAGEPAVPAAVDLPVVSQPWSIHDSWRAPPLRIPQPLSIAPLLPTIDAPPLRVVQPASILQSWRGRPGTQGRGAGQSGEAPAADLPVVAHPWNAVLSWFRESPRRPPAPLFIPPQSDPAPLQARGFDPRAWHQPQPVRMPQPSPLAALLGPYQAPPLTLPLSWHITRPVVPPVRLPSLVQSAALFPVVVADAPPLFVGSHHNIILRAWKFRDRGRIGAEPEPPPPPPDDPPLRRHPPPPAEWWPAPPVVVYFSAPAVSIPGDVLLPRAAVPQAVLNAWVPPHLRLPSLRKEPHWLYFLGDAPPLRVPQPPAVLLSWRPPFRMPPRNGVILQAGAIEPPPLRFVLPGSILQAWVPPFRPLPRNGIIVTERAPDLPVVRFPWNVLAAWRPPHLRLPCISKDSPWLALIGVDPPPLTIKGTQERIVRAWQPGPPTPQQKRHLYPAFIVPDAPPLMVRVPPHVIDAWRKANEAARPAIFSLPWLPEGVPVVYAYLFRDESGPVYVFRDESGHLYYFQDESRQP